MKNSESARMHKLFELPDFKSKSYEVKNHQFRIVLRK